MNETTTRILEAIKIHWRENGYSPSMKDLMEMANISSKSVVSYHLVQLARARHIKRTPRVARSIVVQQSKLQKARERMEERAAEGCDAKQG